MGLLACYVSAVTHDRMGRDLYASYTEYIRQMLELAHVFR